MSETNTEPTQNEPDPEPTPSDDPVVYNLTIDMGNLPKGEAIQIVGLGTFENGSSYEVTASEAERYRVSQQKIDYKSDEDQTVVVKRGPTLLEASKSMYGVTVKKVSS